MRFRGRTIRRKIVALLLVPLVSLTAIWGFATVLTGREAAEILKIGEADDRVGRPVEEAAQVLQDERRRTLVHLADPRASAALGELRRSRTATDQALARVRAGAEDTDATEGLSADSRRRLTALLESFEGIATLRRSVEDNTVTRAAALDLYNRLVDPCFVFLTHLHTIEDVELDKQNRALVSLARARDLLSREDALVASALVGERFDKADLRQVSDLLAQRTLLFETSLPLLPDDEEARYERYWQGAETAPLRDLETSVAASPPGPPHGVTAKSWDTAAGKVLDGLAERGSAAADRYEERVRPVAVGILVRAAATGVLGFAALVLSLYLSVRIGRSLIRDLSRLRHQAHEASGVRLPSVQRRLAAGEQVDVDTEAPRLEYAKNEIGQVGQALNTLQRAAVEGAVKQAQMRRGVSEVFVNLARRSQVLLHKQLTLLDTMERRTEDSEELADLFRLDHLTTRMRRHAEGLVILSGAAPSRQWRRPVQLMDVVRASVAEVEDYERIEVRRLPRIAVTGPAVADLTHLTAELLENATVFSPPHTAVQVHGESVANGFTLEIHDRGLGMAPDVLLDANLRLAETPDFELSDTDRLGLFVVSRLAQRQNIRVSLQKSPYGGTTAVVFIPDALLIETDESGGSTDGRGLALDTAGTGARGPGRPALARIPTSRTPARPLLPDGPVELEAPANTPGVDDEDFPGALPDDDSEPGVFRPRRPLAPAADPRDQHQQAHDDPAAGARPGGPSPAGGGPAPLPRRRTPKLVSSHGRTVAHGRPDEPAQDQEESGTRDQAAAPPAKGPAGLPRRVRQASLAPQLKEARRGAPDARDQDTAHDTDRDADEVRSRMASLQRGWQRGRDENAGSTAPRTTPEGDGR
ncbi:sensor histidine kinase [Streptomyces albidoflavus]